MNRPEQFNILPFEHDSDVDAGYIDLVKPGAKRPKIVSSQSIGENLVLDWSEDGKLVGIEILNVQSTTHLL